MTYTKHLKNFSSNPSQTLPIKVGEEGTHLNSFSEATVTLILYQSQTRITYTQKQQIIILMNIDVELLNNVITN